MMVVKQSNTTKSRLNAILEYNGLPGEKRVYQKAYVWNVRLTDLHFNSFL